MQKPTCSSTGLAVSARDEPSERFSLSVSLVFFLDLGLRIDEVDAIDTGRQYSSCCYRDIIRKRKEEEITNRGDFLAGDTSHGILSLGQIVGLFVAHF